MKQNPLTIEQASEWLATLSDEACTAQERREFAHWLTRSNTHVDEFLRISTLTRRLQKGTRWPQIDLESLLAEVNAERNVVAFAETPPRPLSSISAKKGKRWVAAAAAVLVVVGAAFYTPSAMQLLSGRQSYSTRLGELRSFTLEDGSIVQLNARSSIVQHFTAGERTIELKDGEAIFNVAKDPARPFKVSAPHANIVVVGTRFNVKSQSGQTVVTVLEGRVRVGPESLSAGEQIAFGPKHAARKIANIDAEKVIGWTVRRLYFEDTPLSSAVEDFARGSPQVITIDDPVLKERRITGVFNSADPAALVQFLERYAGATVTKTDEGWTVNSRP